MEIIVDNGEILCKFGSSVMVVFRDEPIPFRMRWLEVKEVTLLKVKELLPQNISALSRFFFRTVSVRDEGRQEERWREVLEDDSQVPMWRGQVHCHLNLVH